VALQRLRYLDLTVLALCLTCGAALRFMDWPHDLYADEIWVARVAGLPIAEFGRAILDDWVHPPFFHGFLRMIDSIVPLADAAPRLIAIFAGILSIPVIYVLGFRAVSRESGLVAAYLLALSPIHVWHSDYGRHYSLLVLLVLISTLAFVELLRDRPGRGWLAGLVIANSVLIATHYFGWLVLGVQVFWLVVRRSALPRHWWAAYAVPLVISVPWAVLVVSAADGMGTAGGELIPQVAWLDPLKPKMPIRTLEEFDGGIPVHMAGGAGLLLFSGLALLGLQPGRPQSTGGRLPWFLAASIAIPFAAVYIVSVLVQPVWLSRVMMITLPAWYLLVAAGSCRFRTHRMMRFLPLAVIGWMAVAAVFHIERIRRVPFETIAAHLERHAGADSVILLQNYYLMNPILRYYEGESPLYQFGDYHVSLAAADQKIATHSGMVPFIEAAGRVIVVTYTRDSSLRTPLDDAFRLEDRTVFAGHSEDGLNKRRDVTVTVHRRRGASEVGGPGSAARNNPRAIGHPVTGRRDDPVACAQPADHLCLEPVAPAYLDPGQHGPAVAFDEHGPVLAVAK